MMNELLSLTLAVSVGLLLGAFFFGGLWWTVRRLASTQRPSLWFFGSLMLRLSITLAGFYVVGQTDWRRLLAGMLGFMAARFAVLRITRLPHEQHEAKAGEVSHAP
jgi:F1F0 ATPase subunit 2